MRLGSETRAASGREVRDLRKLTENGFKVMCYKCVMLLKTSGGQEIEFHEIEIIILLN